MNNPCLNKGCKNYEKGRDNTNCIFLMNPELTQCIEYYGEVIISDETVCLGSIVCEWEYDNDKKKTMSSIKHGYKTPINAVKRYKYCPYCGEPIKSLGLEA